MALTKKGFISLADRLRNAHACLLNWEDHEQYAYEVMLNAIVDWCRTTNPRFNEARFRAYVAGECGPSGGRPRTKKGGHT